MEASRVITKPAKRPRSPWRAKEGNKDNMSVMLAFSHDTPLLEDLYASKPSPRLDAAANQLVSCKTTSLCAAISRRKEHQHFACTATGAKFTFSLYRRSNHVAFNLVLNLSTMLVVRIGCSPCLPNEGAARLWGLHRVLLSVAVWSAWGCHYRR